MSDNPRDKLRAAVSHDWPDADQDFPASYIVACREWYAAMAASDKALAEVARATFEKGDEAGAEKSPRRCRRPRRFRWNSVRLSPALAALILFAPPCAAADLTGQATVIDGDMIEIHG
jgi:hypothetical protein